MTGSARELAAFPGMAALADLAERCNTDERFAEWGRGFTGAVAFRCDDQEGWMRLDGGRVVAVGTGSPEGPAGHPLVRIAGTRERWQLVFDGQQGGLHRAWRHQQLAFDGDRVALLRHYKMVWRLGDLIGGKGAAHAVSA
jgi:hypothetical protein